MEECSDYDGGSKFESKKKMGVGKLIYSFVNEMHMLKWITVNIKS